MITEIVTFHLAPSCSLSTPDTPASKVITDFLAPELAAHGAHDAYYGSFIEKPDVAIIFLEWDSLADHQKFMSSPNYDHHVAKLRTIVENSLPITLLHVPFATSPVPALGANENVGATEVVFFYFPSPLSAEAKAGIMAGVDQMRPVVEASEAMGVWDGWAEEAVERGGEGGEGAGKGKEEGEKEMCTVFVNVVGWESVDAHMKFQTSEAFGANIHHLLGIKEMRGTELYHVKLHKVVV
ncbi:hypothetical protein MMC30_004257 [Trapelia coarctata]|nr:hypothetical protein [Trapelia coarctata]